jgi:hypothetical protein
VSAPKPEETQPPAAAATPATALDSSDPYYKFRSLLKQMCSYHKKSGCQLPAMFCFICDLPFDSYFEWMEHIESPNHNLSGHTNHRCETCHLEIYGLSRDILSFLKFLEHIEVDLLYSKEI